MPISDGYKNLKPVRTKAEAREKGRLGGIASGKRRKKIKDMRLALKAFIEGDFSEERTGAEQMIFWLLSECEKGNVQAIKLVNDMIYGSKQNIDLTNSDGSLAVPKEIRMHFVRPEQKNDG